MGILGIGRLLGNIRIRLWDKSGLGGSVGATSSLLGLRDISSSSIVYGEGALFSYSLHSNHVLIFFVSSNFLGFEI